MSRTTHSRDFYRRDPPRVPSPRFQYRSTYIFANCRAEDPDMWAHERQAHLPPGAPAPRPPSRLEFYFAAALSLFILLHLICINWRGADARYGPERFDNERRSHNELRRSYRK